jgi:RNase P/RNase MRP subunit p29
MSKQGKTARTAIIGETLEVIASKNPDIKGMRGTVLDETRNTIKIMTRKGAKTLVKDQITITIKGRTIDGKELVGRIHERLKQ